MKPVVSIIIVNYNTANLLLNCLESIKKYVNINFEAIVVDNHSTDDSIAMCEKFWKDPEFKLIRSEKNAGFSKANNIGAAAASGFVYHFLNPDTELSPGITQDYLQAHVCSDAVYINPLLNFDGSPENDRMPIPVLRNIRLWNSGSDKAQYWYKGASVIISARNFRKIGGWCEDYFLFAEDLDLFYEIWRHNIPVRDARTKIYHLGGGSTMSRWSRFGRDIQVEKSNRLFFKKHFSRFEHFKSKTYYLFHYMLKRPGYVPRYLATWILSLWL